MLFNSYGFIFAFLPTALLLYHGIRRSGRERTAIAVLVLLSLFFYGWWNPWYLLLLVASILLNFLVATRLLPHNRRHPLRAKRLLVLGVVLNLAMLGYFKYSNFFVNNINALFGLEWFLAGVVLPLGISFYTFQIIALLVDSYQGKIETLSLFDFSLFVSFFPQLIAGPIVHHREMMPQFASTGSVSPRYLTLGITIFTVGLAKKVLLADTAALYVALPFDMAAAGQNLDLVGAWSGALAYTVQLYFDFSGYTDMAIGIALLFGIRLPINFHSPYKATSIIDFWRRWHITLSRFLRDYLYIPLGGNRRGLSRRYTNLLITMLLGGLWHGANWTFVIWGGLHGIYLMINHAWRAVRERVRSVPQGARLAELRLGQAITFLAVVIAWVFFRAANTGAALEMLKAMAGYNGIAPALPSPHAEQGLMVAAALLTIAWLAPNTQELTGYRGSEELPRGDEETPLGPRLWQWRPSTRWALVTGCVFGVTIMSLSRISEFLYFQF